MLHILRTNTFLLENAEEVVTFEEDHRVLLRLCLHVLLKDHFLEELLSRHVLVQQEEHQHDHDFDRLLVKFGQIKLVLALFGALG